MKQTRTQFKYTLRTCRSNETKAKADSLANQLISKDPIEFWKEIRQNNGVQSCMAETIGGATGSKEIVNMWKDHYDNLLNSSNDLSQKKTVMERVEKNPIKPLNKLLTCVY